MGNTRIQLRRGRSFVWAQENPVLANGEPGYETNTKKLKIGDGKTPWLDLPYVPTIDVPALDEHINAEEPHPVYDDGPSLTLIYENAKV